MDFGEFALVPAIADDTVLSRRRPGKVIRLRGARDGGERWDDGGDGAIATKVRDARRVFADKRFGQADDIDDGEALHPGIAAKKRARRKGILTAATLPKFVDTLDDGRGIHIVDLNPATDFFQEGDGQFTAEVFAELFQAA